MGAKSTCPLFLEIERPVFGSDTALYWAAAKAAGVALKPGILGRLTDAC
jgi:hypothetical protein